MFDPTVFDNLKVVIEGALYDLDLDGDLTITDRKDELELATMARHYRITFTRKDYHADRINAYIDLTFDLYNLATELQSMSDRRPGCKLEIGFIVDIKTLDVCSTIPIILEKIWGETRTIQQEISFDYNANNKYTNNIKIIFNRLLYEDNVDDLLEMLEYLLVSLQQINNVTSN
ncbi:hypothetical protein ACLM5H_09750 [Fredinandcohnia humi]